MNKLRFFITILLFIMLPNTIYAACTDEEVLDFKRIEKDYKVTREFNKESKDYTLKFIGTKKDMYDYIVFINTKLECETISEEIEECYHIQPGTYRIGIIGRTTECDNMLKDFSLTLPKYNYLSEDPLCKGIEEFVLCQPDYEKEIDYDTFVSRINTYKKTKQKEAAKEAEEKSNASKIINSIASFIKANLLQIILVIIFITAITVTIILTAKSIRKSRRLE